MTQFAQNNRFLKSTIHQVHIRKDYLKFSAAHMTVFPDGSKEALHGHNYITQVSLDLLSIKFAQMIPFSIFKASLLKICQEWDEKILLARDCPFFEVLQDSKVELEFRLAQKRYVFPRDEIEILPIDNITSEALSSLLCHRLLISIQGESFFSNILALHVRVEESSGQGATTSIYL